MAMTNKQANVVRDAIFENDKVFALCRYWIGEGDGSGNQVDFLRAVVAGLDIAMPRRPPSEFKP